MTKPTKWLWAQRRLGSAWASTQSDQSSLCAQWVAKDPSFLHADSEDSDQTDPPSLIWVFAGCTLILLVFSWRGSFYCLTNRNFSITHQDKEMLPYMEGSCMMSWHLLTSGFDIIIAPLWKSGAILDLPCPVIPSVISFNTLFSGYLVDATPLTIFHGMFWNFADVFCMEWRCACGLDIFLCFSHFLAPLSWSLIGEIV